MFVFLTFFSFKLFSPKAFAVKHFLWKPCIDDDIKTINTHFRQLKNREALKNY